MAGKPYNGHPSWNAWNVALWIGNDEGLYHAAVEAKRKGKGRYVRAFRELTGLASHEKTPDGATYSDNSVLLAIRGIE